MSEAFNQQIKLFYCFAHEDRALRDEFERHLSGMKRHYQLAIWHDREILPGTNWEQTIDERINSADIIFLLISPDFISSGYCYGKEMRRAMERHKMGACLVLPILLRSTHWEGEPFGQLQLLPTDAKPITLWADRDDAFESVARGVGRVIKETLSFYETIENKIIP